MDQPEPSDSAASPPVSQNRPTSEPKSSFTLPGPEPARSEKPEPASSTSEVAQALLSVVCNLTGYPVDMLSLDMDIEADLGIDSIKRVEILSTLQEMTPDLPEVQPEVMGQLKTLEQIVSYLSNESHGKDSPPSSVSPSDTRGSSNDSPDGSTASAKIQSTLIEIVSQLTGYPEDMLSFDMDIESDLGIDSIKRVEILSTLEEKIPELPPIQPEIMGQLKTLGQIISHLSKAEPTVEGKGARSKPGSTVASQSDQTVSETLLNVVSQLTGYPLDMLELDMDIESDLGIDSIKRVEILSVLEEQLPGLPKIDPEAMAGLKTLSQIVQHLTSTDGLPAMPTPAVTSPKESFPSALDKPISRAKVTIKSLQESLDKPSPVSAEGKIYITDDGDGFAMHLAMAFSALDQPAGVLTTKAVENPFEGWAFPRRRLRLGAASG